MVNWQEKSNKEIVAKRMAQEQKNARVTSEKVALLETRRQEYEKRVKDHQRYRIEQQIVEIRDQVWGTGDFKTVLFHSGDFGMDKICTILSFCKTFAFSDVKQVITRSGDIMGGSEFEMRPIIRHGMFFTGLRVDVLPSSLRVRDAAYIMAPGNVSMYPASELDFWDLFGSGRSTGVWNEFYLYGFKPEVSEINLGQQDVEAHLEKALLDSCVRRKEVGLAPINLDKIINKVIHKRWTEDLSMLGWPPPLLWDWSLTQRDI